MKTLSDLLIELKVREKSLSTDIGVLQDELDSTRDSIATIVWAISETEGSENISETSTEENDSEDSSEVDSCGFSESPYEELFNEIDAVFRHDKDSITALVCVFDDVGKAREAHTAVVEEFRSFIVSPSRKINKVGDLSVSLTDVNYGGTLKVHFVSLFDVNDYKDFVVTYIRVYDNPNDLAYRSYEEIVNELESWS